MDIPRLVAISSTLCTFMTGEMCVNGGASEFLPFNDLGHRSVTAIEHEVHLRDK